MSLHVTHTFHAVTIACSLCPQGVWVCFDMCLRERDRHKEKEEERERERDRETGERET